MVLTRKIGSTDAEIHVQGIAWGNPEDPANYVDLDTPLPVFTPSGFLTVSMSFARPADTLAYAAGDLVANSTVLGSLVVPKIQNVMRMVGEAVRVERIRLRKTSVTLVSATFRVHLFRIAPTLSVADNGVFNAAGVLALADITGYVGGFDVTMDVAGAAGASGRGVPLMGSGVTLEASGTVGDETTVWVVIQATAAYVPASGETFTLTLEAART